MNCQNCNKTMIQGIYKCNISSYDIVDNKNNVLIMWESHNIPSDDIEIGDTSQVYYCEDCHLISM
jgi:hypothetical protein